MMKPPGMPTETFIKAVAEMGYSAVEIWERDEHFKKIVSLAKKNGLVVAIMTGHDSLETGLNDSSQHDRIEFELKESIDIAVLCNIPGLICFSGNRMDGLSDEEGIAVTAKGLRRIAPYAEKKGVNLNLELLNSKIDHPGYQCDRSSWGVEVCEKVNSPRVKLLYDIYHMQIMEGDVIRTICKNIQWIGHFHTAGVPGRNDIDETQELNYTAICRAIAATGYNLFLAHEFLPRKEVLEALKKAYSICNQG